MTTAEEVARVVGPYGGRVQAGSTESAGTSGLVAILFTDLVGSTELATQQGDIAADALRRDHFSHLREALASTGGTEVKTIGDALMASFTGASDALAGAVAMQRAVERHNRRLNDGRLEMRVGVSVGDASYEDGDWFGTPVVEASRLCASATAGQILVSDLVRALAGTRHEVELVPLGLRELKGLPEPLVVCEARWERSGDAGTIPLPAFLDVAASFPFSGRSVELERVITHWKESAEGSRRVVLVSGEPGIGKSRLVTEVCRVAHDRGATVLWGRCDEELGIPYEPFAEALRHYAATVDPERLRAEVGPLGGELTRIVPDLAARVPGLAEPLQGEPEAERHRLFESVVDLFGEMSVAAPVVLVLDDVHWADKPSLLLLRHLLRANVPLRLLVIATYRDTDLDRSHPLSDVLADLRREAGVERLDLHGLDIDGVGALMAATAGHELGEAAHELARALADETEGNPFFVGEVLLHLVETGAIVQVDGRWTTSVPLGDMSIPEGIREVIGRRLSRLSETANRALVLGAVVGPTFDVHTIQGAGGPTGDDLFDALDEATRAAIIQEVPGAVGSYAFAHALMRASLYEELTTTQRVRMHWRVGEAIEARHGADLDSHLDELAYHYGEGALAGDAARAVDFARRAGERAMAELAFEAAARHFERALGSIELEETPDRVVRCDLLIAWARALQAGGDERRQSVRAQAVDSARELDDAERFASAVLSLTEHQTGSSRMGYAPEEFVAMLEEALERLSPEPSPLRAQALSTLAMELQWTLQTDRRRELARQALEMARSTDDPMALALVLARSWTLVDGSRPFWGELEQRLDEAETVARDADHASALISVHRLKAMAAGIRGDRAEMDRRLTAERAIAERLREPAQRVLMLTDEACAAGFAGELDRAEVLAVETAEAGSAADFPDDVIMSTLGAQLYMIRLCQGRVGELTDLLADRVEASPGAPVWRVALAGALVESDRVDEARPHFHFLADDDCAGTPPDIVFPVVLCGLGRLSYRIQPDEAIVRSIYEQLAPFTGYFNWTGGTIADANDLGLAMAAATLGDDDTADTHFAAAIDLCQRAGARAYEARCVLDWARVLDGRGDSARARPLAERALTLGTELGMNGPSGVVPRATALLG
jgi:class 3 adenylate cyclase/tetratricopeptide (TPR) repeat protein